MTSKAYVNKLEKALHQHNQLKNDLKSQTQNELLRKSVVPQTQAIVLKEQIAQDQQTESNIIPLYFISAGSSYSLVKSGETISSKN